MTRLQMPMIPGDTVYFMFNNEVYTTTIKEVATRSKLDSYLGITTAYAYNLDSNPAGGQYRTDGFTASELYLSKQALLDEL